MVYRVISGLFLLLLMAGCATLSEEDCIAGDWRGIGQNDGARGRAADFIGNHTKACADLGVIPDVAAWQAGRTEGLKQYCTPANAYLVGRQGQRLSPVCPIADQAALSVPNDRGLRYYEIGRDIDRLERQLYEAGARLAVVPADEIEKISAIQSEMALIRFEIMSLRTRRIAYSRWP